MKLFAISILFFCCNHLLGQEIEQRASKSFLIIESTKKYSRALESAQLACNKLSLTLDLRSLIEDKDEGGLTSNEICGCGEQHGYIPRGRFDDGNYISIEYSSSYDFFSPGYYIVIVASGENETVNSMLLKVKEVYKRAYVKKSMVYMGCMH